MPLPVRSASVRTTNQDAKPTTTSTRSRQSASQASKLRIPKPETKFSSANSTLSEDTSAALICKSPEDKMHSQSSSRIPSPFKATPGAQSTQRPTQLKGHARQRSTILPFVSARPATGHSRSISAVTVNTSATPNNERPQIQIRGINDRKPTSSLASSRSNLSMLQRMVSIDNTAHATPNQRAAGPLTQVELLQNELLQLSVVHDKSSRSLHLYQRSIRSFLDKKQAKLVLLHTQLLEKSRAFSVAHNLSALDKWLSMQGSSQQASQSIQDLSVALRNTLHLKGIFDDEDGLVEAFEGWLSEARVDDRKGDGYASIHVDFERSIAPALRRFEQQITSLTSVLSSLPLAERGSSLACVIQDHLLLAKSMILQCQVMLEIGETIVTNHRRWLDNEIEAALHDLHSESRHDNPDTYVSPLWEI
ncbi:hypothetical protein LTR64_000037 [Lithohypha guttulata]|uniref:uncharacterized protein n=1 Tax=Lithohypha guttulata TaxID=1690604 RepID=UPI002DE013A5|nr:hypothetical protein LTR51_007399 [Lithohypha guttulata]